MPVPVEPIEAEVLAVLRNLAGADAPLGPDTNLVDDIALDSLQLLEAIASVEDRFGLRLDEETLHRIRTVRDLTAAIQVGLR
jgi:acyl carrier protein